MATTWQDRLKNVIGTRGYENCMRRSLQSIILYEAKRCVAHRFPSLRPFQRKAAYMDQVFALLDSLDFIYPLQKAEILWRTASSKEQMDADIAWKREKGIEKELATLATKMKPFVSKAKSHEEAMNMLVQDLYDNLTGFSGKPFPLNWEHAHNHCIMAYRMYYEFDQPDASFPIPISPREISIPEAHPKKNGKKKGGGGGGGGDISVHLPTAAAAGVTHSGGTSHEPPLDVAELLGEGNRASDKGDERRKLLQEVREHLDLLKEFEGVISPEDLAKRKRELYAALPPPVATAPADAAPAADAAATATAAATTTTAAAAAASESPPPTKKAKADDDNDPDKEEAAESSEAAAAAVEVAAGSVEAATTEVAPAAETVAETVASAADAE